MQKKKLEQEERIEVEKEKLQYSLKMKELELSSKSMPPVSFDPSKVFDVTKHIRLVPPFQEKEVDKYFLHFEKVQYSQRDVYIPHAYERGFSHVT